MMYDDLSCSMYLIPINDDIRKYPLQNAAQYVPIKYPSNRLNQNTVTHRDVTDTL